MRMISEMWIIIVLTLCEGLSWTECARITGGISNANYRQLRNCPTTRGLTWKIKDDIGICSENEGGWVDWEVNNNNKQKSLSLILKSFDTGLISPAQYGVNTCGIYSKLPWWRTEEVRSAYATGPVILYYAEPLTEPSTESPTNSRNTRSVRAQAGENIRAESRRSEQGLSDDWFLASLGQNCDHGCAEHGLICKETDMWIHNYEVDTLANLTFLMKDRFDMDVDSGNFGWGTYEDVPVWLNGIKQVFVSDANRSLSSINCTSNTNNWKNRICYCVGPSTARPTQQPSQSPMYVPTIDPTQQLSRSPTKVPTAGPNSLTEMPTNSPTNSPTTPVPTRQPTQPCFDEWEYCSILAMKSQCRDENWDIQSEILSECKVSCGNCFNGTVSPTLLPSISPTISTAPTSTPTRKPSNTPTTHPTLVPSVGPTCADFLPYCGLIVSACNSTVPKTSAKMVSDCQATCGFCTFEPTTMPSYVPSTNSTQTMPSTSTTNYPVHIWLGIMIVLIIIIIILFTRLRRKEESNNTKGESATVRSVDELENLDENVQKSIGTVLYDEQTTGEPSTANVNRGTLVI